MDDRLAAEAAARRRELGDLVRKQRNSLGLNLAQLNELGGPSDRTIGKIENAQLASPSKTTLSKLDRALRWPVGKSASILFGHPTGEAGAAPMPAPAPASRIRPRPAAQVPGKAEIDMVTRHIRLGQAFERAGISSIAARGAAMPAGGGVTLSDTVIDHLIEILNQLPPAGSNGR